MHHAGNRIMLAREAMERPHQYPMNQVLLEGDAMYDERFDIWTREFGALGVRFSRRAGLRLLGAAAIIPPLQWLGNPVMEAKKKHKRKKKGEHDGGCLVTLETPCTNHVDCCDQMCCKLPLEFEGTCCTSDSPTCYVLSNETQRVCMA